MNDVVLNKSQSLERCLQRIEETQIEATSVPLLEDYDRQDIIILNLMRACEISIDLANYLIRQRKLGMPKTSRESFVILAEKNFISQDLAKRLSKMVGFRNLAVHEYQNLDWQVIDAILKNHLEDFREFEKQILKAVK